MNFRQIIGVGTVILLSFAATVQAADPDAYRSLYKPLDRVDFLIQNATILTGDGDRIDGGDVLVRDGKIVSVGPVADVPENTQIIDAAGRWLTPGLIDVHSHSGVFSAPGSFAQSDGNESTGLNTADVEVQHSVWPFAPVFSRALAGGVTTIHVLPGSANLFGGRGVTLKNVPARTVYEMKFPGAPATLKMACGENPKWNYGEKGQRPGTRMGSMAEYRSAFLGAKDYLENSKSEGDAGKAPRDLKNETLAGVLNGDILVQFHCYRADDIANILALSDEFGFQISAIHHATQAYKVADMLVEKDVCVATWPDFWGIKVEAFDGIQENAAMIHAASGCVAIHSDSWIRIQRLNQEASVARTTGNRLGYDISRAEAIKWVTANAARIIGIGEDTGTIATGMNADLVLWSGDPFSVYTKADKVYIDGSLIFDRSDSSAQPTSDFELGLH